MFIQCAIQPEFHLSGALFKLLFYFEKKKKNTVTKEDNVNSLKGWQFLTANQQMKSNIKEDRKNLEVTVMKAAIKKW